MLFNNLPPAISLASSAMLELLKAMVNLSNQPDEALQLQLRYVPSLPIMCRHLYAVFHSVPAVASGLNHVLVHVQDSSNEVTT